MTQTAHLALVDVIIIIASLVAVAAIGVWSALKRRNATANEYFLSERSLPWWVLGASLFASNIGAEHFIGMGGTASKHGVVVACLEWLGIYMILALGFIIGPVYIRCKLATIPQWFELRFDRKCRMTLICATMIVYGGNKIAGCLYGGALFFRVVFGVDIWVTVPLLLLATGLYTIGGGLDAIVFADVVQTCIFMVGGTMAAVFSLNEVGGFHGLWQSADMFELDHGLYTKTWRPLDSTPYPGTGLVTGGVLLMFWYWAVDQEMAQRVLGAKSTGHARAGTLVAAALKLTTPLIIVIPGMVARVLFEKCKRGLGHEEWCATNLDQKGESDNAYAYIVVHLLPVGVVGIITSSIIAAVMSSLGAVFNSLATILTMDVYKVYRPEANDDDCVWFGRCSMGVMTVMALGWIPVLQFATKNFPFFVIIQTISSALAPTISVTVLLGMFVPRINAEGAFAGMIVGVVLGAARLTMVFIYNDTCMEHSYDQMTDQAPPTVCWDFMHFSAVLGMIVAIVTTSVSLFFPPQDLSAIRHTMILFDEPQPPEKSQDDEERSLLGDKIDTGDAENNPVANEESTSEATLAEPAVDKDLTKPLDSVEDPVKVDETLDIGSVEPAVKTDEPNSKAIDAVEDEANDQCGPDLLHLHYLCAALILMASWILVVGAGTNFYGLW